MFTMLRLVIRAALLAASANAQQLASVVGPPEIVGGPTCCLFDSPFLALQTSPGTTTGYTANSNTFVWSVGATISDQLPMPTFTGLGPDANATSYSHCGKWLNAAWADTKGIVHGFFHQEWHCDYADGLYTNKSVGYARSTDGGRTFFPWPQPTDSNPAANQLIAGSNFSSSHQTGEGDQQVLQVNEDWLFLYFAEWDGPDDTTTIGVGECAAA
jgi:hypothetical protein